MKKRQYQHIVNEQKDRIFNYAFYHLKNREDAEDVTQDVFIRLWNHWPEIDRNKTTPWLLRVTYNRCIDIVRRRKNYENRMQDSIHQSFENVIADQTRHNRPDAQMEISDTQRTLLKAMDLLPEKTKSILLLHYFEGLQYKTISEILDLNVSAVKTAVHRGKKVLKDNLKTHYPEMAVSS